MTAFSRSDPPVDLEGGYFSCWKGEGKRELSLRAIQGVFEGVFTEKDGVQRIPGKPLRVKLSIWPNLIC